MVMAEIWGAAYPQVLSYGGKPGAPWILDGKSNTGIGNCLVRMGAAYF